MSTSLIIAAHPDDEVLGCGGTIASLAANSEQVAVLIMTGGDSDRNPDKYLIKEQAIQSAKILGAMPPSIAYLQDQKLDVTPLTEITKLIQNAITLFEPHTVYTHSPADLNQDHRRVFEATLIATRPVQGQVVRRVFSYYVPSATEWGFSQFGDFRPNTFVDISEHIQAKLASLNCYTQEVRPFPHPRSSIAILDLARTWGATCGLPFAEAFTLIREVRATNVHNSRT